MWLNHSSKRFFAITGRSQEAAAISVFAYHGVVPSRGDARLERNLHLVSDFRQQVRWLSRFRVITISQLADELAAGEPPSQPTVVITFDDGYANNLLAAEILAEAKLPWTVFVSTAAMGKRRVIWTVELSLLLLQGNCDRLETLGRTWQLNARQLREAAFQAIRYPMKSMPASLRQKTMHGIRAQFPDSETERLLEQFPAFQMLTWLELRQLAIAGVEIGSHGMNHELHHALQEPETRREELVESKQEIEQQLGRPCRFFAFPNGDCCEASALEVEVAGYELAFISQAGFVRPNVGRHPLPRVSPGGSLAKLQQQLRELR